MEKLDFNNLLSALQLGETVDWEFKSAKGGVPKNFWETYSAMANSEGGSVVLGISERAGEFVIEGLNQNQLVQYQKALFDGAHNKTVVNRNLIGSSDVEIVVVMGKMLLIVRIRRASRTERPVHVGPSPFGNTYKRAYEGDYRCDDTEVRRMLADADPIPADHRILKGFTFTDLDAQSLTQYRLRMLAAMGQHPWLSLADKEFLTQLGGWRFDRSSGDEGLTLAGILMFGKNIAIRDPEAVPGFFVDYRERMDPAFRYTDRLYPDGTWESNLFQFYQRVLPKILAGVPTPFILEGVERRDVTPAHEALREAVVNALIHSDYRVGGGVVFERYPDRFLIQNPGTLLVSLEQYHRGGTSECRNPGLQIMFRFLGGGEQAGSGVARIKHGWSSRHWRSPSLELTTHPDRVHLTLPMISLIPDSALAVLRERFGSRIDGLDANELQALATASIEGFVTNERLQDLAGLHPADITRLLVGLCSRGFLHSDNRRRWTSYRLVGIDYGKNLTEKDESSSFTGNEADLTSELHEPVGGSPEPNGGSPEFNGGSPEFNGGSPELSMFLSFAEPVASRKRASPILVRSVIMRMCASRYLNADLLAAFLKRDSKKLQERYLGPMVEEGILELRYPETPNRPDQSYRTKMENLKNE